MTDRDLRGLLGAGNILFLVIIGIMLYNNGYVVYSYFMYFSIYRLYF